MENPTLFWIDREAISDWESDVLAGAVAAGALVPVEPVGTLTVIDEPGYTEHEFDRQLPSGTYLIVKADHE